MCHRQFPLSGDGNRVNVKSCMCHFRLKFLKARNGKCLTTKNSNSKRKVTVAFESERKFFFLSFSRVKKFNSMILLEFILSIILKRRGRFLKQLLGVKFQRVATRKN